MYIAIAAVELMVTVQEIIIKVICMNIRMGVATPMVLPRLWFRRSHL